jgi:pimeloyl-ACP methyl ester carboxylesterase
MPSVNQPLVSAKPAEAQPVKAPRAAVKDAFEIKTRAKTPDGAPKAEAVQTMKLEDGRTLAWSEFGAANGKPVLFFHGMAGSLLDAKFYAAAAKKQGIRLIALDRPGYGSSTASRPGMQAYLADVVAFMKAQKLSSVPVMGWSGGAAFAAALAHDHPKLVSKLTLVSPFSFSSNSASLLRLRGLRASLPQLSQMSFDAITKMYSDDAAILTEPKLRAVARKTFAAGKRQGVAGLEFDIETLFATDDYLFKNIKVPVVAWKGFSDVVIPSRLPGRNDSNPRNFDLHVLYGEDDSGHMGAVLHANDVMKSTKAPG